MALVTAPPRFPDRDQSPPFWAPLSLWMVEKVVIQGARYELSGHKPDMMTLIGVGIVVAFAASLTSSLGFSKLTSGVANAQFLRHFRLNVIDHDTATPLGAQYVQWVT
jgi:hypothetical protein